MHLPNCSLEETLPSCNCVRPGLLVDLALAVLRVAVGPNARLQVIPAWGLDLTSEGGSNRSVLSLVQRGEADMTLPIFGLNQKRTEALRWTGPTYEDGFFYYTALEWSWPS